MSSPTSLIVLASGASTAQAGPPAWMQFLPLLAMGVIFWLLILRPQMRRQKEHQSKVAALKKGDQVVTAGGLLAKVLKVDEHYVDLELGQGIKVKAVKATIGDVIPPAGAAPAND